MKLLYALLLLCLACSFKPDLDGASCQVPCTSECAGDFSCRDGYCVSPDVEDGFRCPQMMGPRSEHVCAGDPVSVSLSASGGYENYRWSLSGAPEWVSLKDAKLLGSPMVADEYTFEVNLVDNAPESDGVSSQAIVRKESIKIVVEKCSIRPTPKSRPDAAATSEVDGGVFASTVDGGVSESPAADAQAADAKGPMILEPGDLNVKPAFLPDACVGQPYLVELVADGGAGNFKWGIQGGAEVLPDGLTLGEKTGLLSGIPVKSGDHELPIIVRSDGSATRANRSLRVRNSCRFAFLDSKKGTGRLFLGNTLPEAGQATPAAPVELSKDVAESHKVTHFEFSPNGAWVAFVAVPKSESSDVADQFWLASLTAAAGPPENMPSAQLGELQRIRHFAWNEAGDRLGLIYVAASGNTKLSVLELTSEPPSFGRSERIFLLDDGGLFWLGPRICYLGFLDTGSYERVGPACHTVGDKGALGLAQSERLLVSGAFPEDGRLQLQTSGHNLAAFIAVGAGEPFELRHFFVSEGQWGALDHVFGIPDPTFKWLAQPGSYLRRNVPNPSVDIFRFDIAVETYGDFTDPPAGVVENCTRIAAWHGQGRAIACASDDELRVARLSADGSIEAQSLVGDSSGFGSSDLPGVFDVSAEWFVYAAGGLVRKVDLRAAPDTENPWRAVTVMPYAAGQAVAFTVVGPRGTLLMQTGQQLKLLRLDDSSTISLQGDHVLHRGQGCGNEFSLNGPLDWCGGPLAPKSYAAFPDGSAVLFPSISGTLFSVDVYSAQFDGEGTPKSVLAEARVVCNSGCGDTIRLAP